MLSDSVRSPSCPSEGTVAVGRSEGCSIVGDVFSSDEIDEEEKGKGQGDWFK